MSYFSSIYSDNSLPIRAKTVYMYLRDRSDKERKCWPGINTIAAELNLGSRQDFCANLFAGSG